MNAATAVAVAQSKEAEDQGADGLMILPPYYYTPTDDEIFRYYEAITDAVRLPIMLYNNPVTSNVDMSAALVARLAAAFPSVSYIKESSQELGRVTDVIELAGEDIVVYAGERVVDSFLLGAKGYVNPYGNYIPRASAGIWSLLTPAGSPRHAPSSATSTPSTPSSRRAIRRTGTSATPSGSPPGPDIRWDRSGRR